MAKKSENPEVTSSTSDEEDEFDVQQIIDKRKKKGRIEYYLKWKGYPHTENTWEPESNMKCPDLIKEYELSLKDKGEKKATTKDRPSLRTKGKDTSARSSTVSTFSTSKAKKRHLTQEDRPSLSTRGKDTSARSTSSSSKAKQPFTKEDRPSSSSEAMDPSPQSSTASTSPSSKQKCEEPAPSVNEAKNASDNED